MKDKDFMDDDSEINDIEMDDLEIKAHLNEALSFKGITVSEDIIGRTLAAIKKSQMEESLIGDGAVGDTVVDQREITSDTKKIVDISDLNTNRRWTMKKVFQYSSIAAASLLLLVGLSSGLGGLNRKNSAEAPMQMDTTAKMESAPEGEERVSADLADEEMKMESTDEMYMETSGVAETEGASVAGSSSLDVSKVEAGLDGNIADIPIKSQIAGNEKLDSDTQFGDSSGMENELNSTVTEEITEEGYINTMSTEETFPVVLGLNRKEIGQVTIYDIQYQKEIQLDEAQIDRFYLIMNRTEYKKADHGSEAGGMTDPVAVDQGIVDKDTTNKNNVNKEAEVGDTANTSIVQGTTANNMTDIQSGDNMGGTSETGGIEAVMGYQVNILRKNDPEHYLVLWIGNELEVVDTINTEATTRMVKYLMKDQQTILDGLVEFFEKIPQ